MQSASDPNNQNKTIYTSYDNQQQSIAGQTTIVLATALIRCQNGCDVSESVRALCDTGAQMNLRTKDCAKRLNLTLMPCSRPLLGIGGSGNEARKRALTHIVPHFQSAFTIHAEILIVEQLSGIFPAYPLQAKSIPPGILLADPEFDKPAPIDMLIGAEVWAASMLPRMYIKNGEAVVHHTELGHIVLRKFQVKNDTDNEQSMIFQAIEPPNTNESSSLNTQLRKFWEFECLPESKKPRSKEEDAAEQLFVSTHYRNEIGRYVVKMPIKPESLPLGDSRNIALRQFFQLERRLTKNTELREKYVAFMREYENCGHMRRLTTDIIPKAIHYYIPHHAVQKRFRVVYNASSKTTNGISLNDIQMIGEKLQPDLADQVMKFRLHRIAFSADVVKMFRQVCIDSSQWDLQRIFWREKPSDPLGTYQLTVVTYGMAASAHLAVRAMIQCARDQSVRFPAAAKIIETCMYMDDLLAGCDTAEEAMVLCREIDLIMRNGGFELSKWGSNLRDLEKSMRGDTNTKMELGESDEITIHVQETKTPISPTKREILSEIARLYDPNGLIGPVIVKGKILMQDLWRDNELKWDSQVPNTMKLRWQTFHEQLQNLTQFRVPRWLKTGPNVSIQIHGFCDASMKAYGATIYIRTVNYRTNNINSGLLVSKSRVAPLKTLSIPRLELCAAELLSKLVANVLSTCGLHQAECYMWSDSMVVLHWLKKSPHELKTFVANRIANIQTISQATWWAHVSTSDNPADLLSRGTSPDEIIANKKWLHGPKWLLQPQTHWPKPKLAISMDTKDEIIKEEKQRKHILCVYTSIMHGNDLMLHRYSNFTKILRVTSYVFRFINNCRERNTGGPRLLDVNYEQIELPSESEKKNARNFWIRNAQEKAFKLEIECIKSNDTQYPAKSKIVALRSMLDDDGLLRASGRIGKANRTKDQNHPIIVPPKTRLTFLLLDEAHHQTGHGGTQAMM